MRSAVAVSYELDDVSAAVTELSAEIRSKLTFGTESVGLLFSQTDIDISGLSGGLSAELGFDIIGGTTAGAATLSQDGFHELAVTLHVLTADDCSFASLLSEPLNGGDITVITQACRAAKAKLGDEVKMGFYIAPLPTAISLDCFVAAVSAEISERPVFGFVAADDFKFDCQSVFINGEVFPDRMALLLIAGNVRPVSVSKNLASSKKMTRKKVTRSEGCTIYEIDGIPAYEYIKAFPFIEDENSLLWSCQLFIEVPGESGVSVSRVLKSFDTETGCISCFAEVPQGSDICLMYCEGADVRNSCRDALDELNARIADTKDDYKYSTAIFISCNIRNMFLVDDKAAEGELIKAMLPPGLAASGVYAYGEIAPTAIKNDKAVNVVHNATMTVCAI